LLRAWTEAKACPQYESLKQASKRKSDEEADLKRWLSWSKRQVANQRLFQFEDEHSPLYVKTPSLMDDAVAAYEDAKKEWAALDRSTRSKGMHQLLDETIEAHVLVDAFEDSSSVFVEASSDAVAGSI
jgi:acyl-CoA reductase-like NAD-dependent aldehyde dehydrogenase